MSGEVEEEVEEEKEEEEEEDEVLHHPHSSPLRRSEDGAVLQ